MQVYVHQTRIKSYILTILSPNPTGLTTLLLIYLVSFFHFPLIIVCFIHYCLVSRDFLVEKSSREKVVFISLVVEKTLCTQLLTAD